MSEALPPEIRRRIERHVDELLNGLEIRNANTTEARTDFVLHLETEARAQLARGLHPRDALEHALERFGDAESIRGQLTWWASGTSLRALSGTRHGDPSWNHRNPLAAVARWGSDLLQDVRFATRSIRLQPGFTATVVLTIAIGIAATTTIFSVVDGILLRPLPYAEPDRIVAIWPTFWFSNANFEVFQKDLLGTESSSFSAVAGYSPRNAWYRDEEEGTKSISGSARHGRLSRRARTRHGARPNLCARRERAGKREGHRCDALVLAERARRRPVDRRADGHAR